MGVLELRLARHWHGLHPWAGVGWATDGATYLCAGLFYPMQLARGIALNIGGAPGHYERNRGRDLGSSFEFLSFAELSWTFPHRSHQLSIGLAHISNGSISDHNPGSEILRVACSIPLGRNRHNR